MSRRTAARENKDREDSETSDPHNSSLPVGADELLSILDEMGIEYELHEHRPVFTVEESEDLKAHIPGLHCRNLFLRDKKKRMFLITAGNDTEIDLKALPDLLDCKRLSFGSEERLWQYLGVRAGSVCPFAIINDTGHDVTLILDRETMEADMICVHPMENHLSVVIAPADIVRFAKHTGHKPVIVDFNADKIVPPKKVSDEKVSDGLT